MYALKKVTFQTAEAKADIVQEADVLFEAVSSEFVVGFYGRQEQGNEMWVSSKKNSERNRSRRIVYSNFSLKNRVFLCGTTKFAFVVVVFCS